MSPQPRGHPRAAFQPSILHVLQAQEEQARAQAEAEEARRQAGIACFVRGCGPCKGPAEGFAFDIFGLGRRRPTWQEQKLRWQGRDRRQECVELMLGLRRLRDVEGT